MDTPTKAVLSASIYMSLSQWCVFLYYVILYFKGSLNNIEATGFSCESLAPASMKTQIISLRVPAT